MAETQHPSRSARLGWSAYAGYACGDFAFNLAYGTFLGYSVYFYTDVCRIPTQIVATLILLSRIVNAAVDPLVGHWIDRWSGRERARPFIKWGAAPLGVALALSFVPLDASLAIKIAWATATYLGTSVLYSIANIPYGILLNLTTLDPTARVRLASARMIGANFGLILIGLVTLSAARFLGDGNIARGFVIFGLIVGTITTTMLFFTWATSVERAEYEPGPASLWASVSAMFTHREWVRLTGSMALNTASAAMLFGMTSFCILSVFGRSDTFVGEVIALLTLCSVLGTPLAPLLSARFGARRLCIASNLLQAVLLAALVFVQSIPLLLLLCGAVGILVGMREPAIYSLLSISLEKRTDTDKASPIGLGYSLNSAFIKVAIGAAGAAIGALLAAGGYVEGAASQSSIAIWAIRLGFAGVPALLVLGGALLLFLGRDDADHRHATVVAH